MLPPLPGSGRTRRPSSDPAAYHPIPVIAHCRIDLRSPGTCRSGFGEKSCLSANDPLAAVRNPRQNPVMSKLPKTPQEKKALSLANDRRNTYGNNQKAARKAIPLRKALESRRVRHKDNQALSQISQLDEAALDLAESSARHSVSRLGGWQKSPDEPLGTVIDRALNARGQRVGRKVRARFDYGNGS